MGSGHVGQEEEQARALYATHATALLAYVRRLLDGDRQQAEDIVQETLLRAWRHRTELDVATARPWLFTTARRLVVDLYRARNARPIELLTDRCEGVDRFDRLMSSDAIDRALNAIIVADALASLSSAHRAVLIDCYYRGRTAVQIAADRGLPPGTARSRIHYALRALRLALNERGVFG